MVIWRPFFSLPGKLRSIRPETIALWRKVRDVLQGAAARQQVFGAAIPDPKRPASQGVLPASLIQQGRLNEGVSLGIAGAVLAVLLAVTAWWAPRGAGSGESCGGGRRVTQKARAGRDVYMAGRDMKISQRRKDE